MKKFFVFTVMAAFFGFALAGCCSSNKIKSACKEESEKGGKGNAEMPKGDVEPNKEDKTKDVTAV
jgi:hypothetical protein